MFAILFENSLDTCVAAKKHVGALKGFLSFFFEPSMGGYLATLLASIFFLLKCRRSFYN